MVAPPWGRPREKYAPPASTGTAPLFIGLLLGNGGLVSGDFLTCVSRDFFTCVSREFFTRVSRDFVLVSLAICLLVSLAISFVHFQMMLFEI